MKAFCIAVLICGQLAFAGCLSFTKHPGGIQSQAFEINGRSYEVLGEAEGFSSSFTFFWLLPLMPPATLDEAIEEAIRSKGGDNLIDIHYYKERDVYFTGTVDAIRVKGRVIKYTNVGTVQKEKH